jgi:AmmeMemoRadiSam system protein A
MNLKCAFLMPHPPVMVPEIGGADTKKIKNTVSSARRVARFVKQTAPETVVLITSHGPVFRDAVGISVSHQMKGDLGNFGRPDLKFNFTTDDELADSVIKSARESKVPSVVLDKTAARIYGIPLELDHGAMVPLYFICAEYKNFRLLHITMALLPFEQLYAFGKALQQAIERVNRKIVLIISGDLSHRLTLDAPAGYSPKGREFDEGIVDNLKRLDAKSIINIDKNFAEDAGECGLRPVIMMLGALDGLKVNSQIYSYEGPFGVGYCVAGFEVTGEDNRRRMLSDLQKQAYDRIVGIRDKEDPYVVLARKTLETYVKEGRELKPSEDLPEEMLKQKAGVFVSLKKDGELRGCIGTIMPTQPSLAHEIIQNAISAGCHDPRFYPVKPDELDSMVYSVDVLTSPKPVRSKKDLDPKRYGVIVQKGRRTGLLLPDLEGVDTVDEQLKIACQKAGINPYEDYEIQCFEVIRHH